MKLQRLLFPDRCACCGRELPTGEELCERCAPELHPARADVCPVCERETCVCRNSAFSGFAAAWTYDGAAAAALRRVKFSGRVQGLPWLGRRLGEAVRARFPGVRFDIIAPVPMTRRSLEVRGFNQAAELARGAAEVLGARLEEGLLQKPRDVKKQSRLTAEKRRANVLGAFTVPQPERVRGMTVLVVDDLRTTGATLEECGRTLALCAPAALYAAALALDTPDWEGN